MGILFWVIMIVALLFFGLGHFGVVAWGFFGAGLVVFVLLALLGWKVFGPPIQ
jgi:hypothetical protein